MGILGKGKGKREQDAENLKKCIKNFSSGITKISFKNGENFDKITYEKFSNAYNTAFNEYIISKKWISHTNDVLKEISKKIKKYDNKPILEQTYKEYCNCYRYNPDKRKKDAAIDQESIIGEYSQMLVQLEVKLKHIVKSRKYSDIKTSGQEFDEGSKQKALFEKFETFDKKLDDAELDGKYNQISKIFRDTFEQNIKGKGIDGKNKWFSHTNDVFKAINKKLKKFDKLGIDKKTYKDYLECFKYDQQKSSKKAAINDDRLFKSYQKLYEKILTKLKEYFKYILSPDEAFENAYEKYKDILKKEEKNIFGTLGIMELMKKCFEGLNDGNTICNLFSQVMLDENGKGWHFYDSRVNASKYFKGFKEPDDKNIKKFKVYTEKFIRNRVKSIEEKLGKELVSLNLKLDNGSDFSNKFIFNYLNKNYKKYLQSTSCSVIKTINATCTGNFTICETGLFGGTWHGDNYIADGEEIYLKLEKINIKGGTLTKIGEGNFICPILKEINFDNVEISEYVDLENMEKKFGSATVNIGGIDIDQWIKEEKNFSDNLEKGIELDNDFNLYDCLNKVANLKLIRKAVLNKGLNTVKKLIFKSKVERVTLENEAFKIIDKDIKFTDLQEIEFTGKLCGIDEGAFSEKPANLAKITFTGIDGSIEKDVKYLEEMSKIAQKGNVAIYINNKNLSEIIEEKKKEEKQD